MKSARLLASLSLSIIAAHAAEPSFKSDIAPILHAKCVTCHNPEKAKGHYQLDTFERFLIPGDSEKPPITPGSPDKSWLYQLLVTSDADDRMPQKEKPLPPEQISLIKNWIEAGAKFDGDDPSRPLATLIETAYPAPPAKYPHPLPITALALAGSKLFAGGYHEILVFENGSLSGRWTNAPRQMHALELSPDGAWLAYAGGSPGRSGEAGLFRVSDGAKANVLGRYSDVALAVRFTPNSECVIAAGADNTIHVYDRMTGRELRSIQQHADWVTSLDVSPDGKQILSGSRDKTARIYDVDDGELHTTYTEHTAPIWAVAFASDGKEAFSAGRDKVIRRWGVAEGNNLGKFDCTAEIMALQVAGERLVAGLSNGEVRQYDLAKKSLARTVQAGTDYVYAIAFNAESLVAGSQTGAVHQWNPTDNNPIRLIPAAP